MTNTLALALISIHLVTNWTSIGTFTDKKGNSFDVKEGRLFTNTVINLTYEDKIHMFTLKSLEGPVIGEQKTRINVNYLQIMTYTNCGIKVNQ